MNKVVIIPGGFHPFHAGHMALYNSAKKAFPGAQVFIAATADTSSRPFPFELKRKLAQLAGVPASRFVQVKSPFVAREITQGFDPDRTQLIFVRSEKDRNEPPIAGTTKKNGDPSYLQPAGNDMKPMSTHGYMAYLPTVDFGGMTSATQIRNAWPGMKEQQKYALVKMLYPKTENNDSLAQVAVKAFDTVLGSSTSESVSEGAVLVNDPEEGIQIRPAGGMGTWTEDTLKSSLAQQFTQIVEYLKTGSYSSVEHVLYKAGAMESKVKALARLQDFKEKQGRRPIAKGREIDIGEDYVQESKSQ